MLTMSKKLYISCCYETLFLLLCFYPMIHVVVVMLIAMFLLAVYSVKVKFCGCQPEQPCWSNSIMASLTLSSFLSGCGGYAWACTLPSIIESRYSWFRPCNLHTGREGQGQRSPPKTPCRDVLFFVLEWDHNSYYIRQTRLRGSSLRIHVSSTMYIVQSLVALQNFWQWICSLSMPWLE